MTGYTKWDRAGCIDRVGGSEEAERRRRELIGRQSGFRRVHESQPRMIG
jgi:hypothetical protein